MVFKINERKGGLRIVGSGGGGKGGGSARTPVESPDSLHNTAYAVLLDVIGNGEMAGPVHAGAPLKDIFLDGTPIQNEDGSLNFQDVQVEVRHGTQDQEHIPGFPSSASTTNVGVEVKTSQPWTQQITNPDLSAVRVTLHWPQLMKMVAEGKTAGDRTGYKIDYAIDLAVGSGAYSEKIKTSVDGKSVNGYSRTHRIELPAGSLGWRIRVRRLSPSPNLSNIQDRMFVQSYAEVIDGKFRYPMTALVGIKISAEQFQAIPTRAFRWKGQIIRVPSNYDPINRTYSGTWDGTFKRAWSNNPAWVYYDMLMNKLYGLGERVDASMIDRYALYQIGAYCDQLVSDGQGGQEPRFTCTTYIQAKADALRVLNDLTSVFRGMAYWANGQIVAVADAPSDPVYTYTNANVENGRFEYTGADISTRKTVALVSWNDPTDFYRAKVEVVNDDDGIRRYGVRKTEITAFGATSRGQAQRAGLYALYTSRMETGGIAFSVGLDGVIPQPGSIVKIADKNRAGRAIGGRIRQSSGNSVMVDRAVIANVGDRLTVILPNGKPQTRTIVGKVGRTITVSPGYSQTPKSQSVWALDSDELSTQYARVVSISERDGITYDIAAVSHHPGKFDAIDSGVRLDPLPITVVPPRTQRAPTNIQISDYVTVHQGTTRHSADISWDAAEHAITYDVQWRRDNGDWVGLPRTGSRSVQLDDIYSGMYTARVRAINALDVPSMWGYSDAIDLDGQIGDPPSIVALLTESEIFGIKLRWVFADTPNIISKTELWYSETPELSSAIKLGDFAYPQNTHTMFGLRAAQTLYFWARLVDKNGEAGAFYPAGNGVAGTSNTSASDYLDYFDGLIGEDQLATGLIESIVDEFDGSVTGSISEWIAGNVTGDNDGEWWAGDSGDYVGNLSILQTINTDDLKQQNLTEALAVKLADTEAAYKREVKVLADGQQALSQETVLLGAEINSNRAALSRTSSALANETQARATEDLMLKAGINSNTALVNQTSTALANTQGDLESTYSLRTQINSNGVMYAAGMSLGVTQKAGQPVQSRFNVLADRFSVLNTINGILTTPFTVSGGQVFIRDALIENGSITNLKIGNIIESHGYQWGNGWRLDKAGNLYAFNGYFGGELSAATGTFSGSLSAATGTFSGTLTANAINAVRTINIAGNSVTVHGAVGDMDTYRSLQDGVTLTFNLAQPAVINLWIIRDGYRGIVAPRVHEPELLVNGVRHKSFGSIDSPGPFPGTYITNISLGPGTQSINFRVAGSGDSTGLIVMTALVAFK